MHDSAVDYLGLRQHAIKQVHGTAARREVSRRSTVAPGPGSLPNCVRFIKVLSTQQNVHAGPWQARCKILGYISRKLRIIKEIQ